MKEQPIEFSKENVSKLIQSFFENDLDIKDIADLVFYDPSKEEYIHELHTMYLQYHFDRETRRFFISAISQDYEAFLRFRNDFFRKYKEKICDSPDSLAKVNSLTGDPYAISFTIMETLEESALIPFSGPLMDRAPLILLIFYTIRLGNTAFCKLINSVLTNTTELD